MVQIERIREEMRRLLLASMLVGVAGLNASALGDQAPCGEALAKLVYGRATNAFERAFIYKPSEKKDEELAFRLAPLIVQQALPGDPHSQDTRGRPGRVEFSAVGKTLDTSRPTVYWTMNMATICGKSRPRLTYIWFYNVPGSSPAGPETALPFQGVRLTLNENGNPVLWEVLADPSGFDLLFVAESLERIAEKQHGKPAAQRKYAVERPALEAPQTIVARVIEDSPVAMGPILYLSADASVSTLICRCMPSQAKEVIGTSTYDLVPIQASDASSFTATLQTTPVPPKRFLSGEGDGERSLDSVLRLPDGW